MNLIFTRIAFVLMSLWIAAMGKYYLLLYEIAIWGACEFFSWYAKPMHQKDLSLYRSMSLIYMLFICVDRMYKPELSYYMAQGINVLEHLVFAIMAMNMLLFLKRIFIPDLKNIFVLSGLFLACNVLGAVNELYQNMVHRTIFDFTADSVKDIIVNFIASLLFIAVDLFRQRRSSL